MRFRQALINAAEQAFSDGELSRGELIKIRFASALPRVRDQLEQCCAEEAASQNKLPAGASVGNVAAIDWSTLLSFIKELLPFILQIIALF